MPKSLRRRASSARSNRRCRPPPALRGRHDGARPVGISLAIVGGRKSRMLARAFDPSRPSSSLLDRTAATNSIATNASSKSIRRRFCAIPPKPPSRRQPRRHPPRTWRGDEESLVIVAAVTVVVVLVAVIALAPGDDDEGVDVDAGSPGSRSTTEVTSTSQPPAGNVLSVWPHSGELAMRIRWRSPVRSRFRSWASINPIVGSAIAAPTAGEGTVAVRARTDGPITTVSLHQRADKRGSCSAAATPDIVLKLLGRHGVIAGRALRRRRSRATSSSTSARTATPRPSAGAS